MHFNAETLAAAIEALPLALVQDTRQHVIVVDTMTHSFGEGAQGKEVEAHTEKEQLGVMRKWTHNVPLRHQGVLVTAIRGCDVAPKEDSSKHLTRMLRRAILNPADHRETAKAGGFFGFEPGACLEQTLQFLHSLDQYPLHYIMHLCHACEVVAYKHPNEEFRNFFLQVYTMMVHKFHLRPESVKEMDERLTLDRIAAGTTERDF